jgi:decaprenylphospho-beta-D-erythro-pentofuranosid-2-ulose 2-reductase
MKDALGSVESVLVLGGGSEIAQATVDKLVAGRTKTVVLAARNPDSLADYARALESHGASKVEALKFDALDFDSHAAFVEDVFSVHGSFDLVVLAFGVLGDQAKDEQDPKSAVHVIESNFTGAASILLHVAQRLKKQGHGSIVALSTVAGERARAANYIYGSSKAGLDAFCQGLGDSLVGTGVSLMIVRPGFVTTKMTAGMDVKPMATDADSVANVIIDGLAKGREIVWAPAKLRFVFSVMRHLPRPVFRKIKA